MREFRDNTVCVRLKEASVPKSHLDPFSRLPAHLLMRQIAMVTDCCDSTHQLRTCLVVAN